MPKKNETLKNKAFEIDPNADAEEGSAFWFKDVKSAVQGLLNSIDFLYTRFEKYDVWSKSNDEVCDMCERYFKEQIKKWFPDVVDGNDNEKIY